MAAILPMHIPISDEPPESAWPNNTLVLERYILSGLLEILFPRTIQPWSETGGIQLHN